MPENETTLFGPVRLVSPAEVVDSVPASTDPMAPWLIVVPAFSVTLSEVRITVCCVVPFIWMLPAVAVMEMLPATGVGSSTVVPMRTAAPSPEVMMTSLPAKMVILLAGEAGCGGKVALLPMEAPCWRRCAIRQQAAADVHGQVCGGDGVAAEAPDASAVEYPGRSAAMQFQVARRFDELRHAGDGGRGLDAGGARPQRQRPRIDRLIGETVDRRAVAGAAFAADDGDGLGDLQHLVACVCQYAAAARVD